MTQQLHSQRAIIDHIVMFICSVMLVCFFFYIDEGYYSLAWMKDPLAWLGVFLTAAFLLFGQTIVYHLLFVRLQWIGKAILSFILGTVLTLGSFFGLIWLITRG